MNNNEKIPAIPPMFGPPERRFALRLLPLTLLPMLGGCVTDAQFLAQNSPGALQTAESRGKFELNCPTVQSTILSQKVTQSLQTGGPYGWRGMGPQMVGPWTEYTIGVRGCGREVVYVTICRDANNCNALAQTASVLPTPPQ